MCGHPGHHHRHRARHVHDVASEERLPRVKGDDKRASDSERETVVSELRAHAGEGRLSAEELDERIEAALAATKRSDPAGLTDDLPRARRPRAGLDALNPEIGRLRV